MSESHTIFIAVVVEPEPSAEYPNGWIPPSAQEVASHLSRFKDWETDDGWRIKHLAWEIEMDEGQ